MGHPGDGTLHPLGIQKVGFHPGRLIHGKTKRLFRAPKTRTSRLILFSVPWLNFSPFLASQDQFKRVIRYY